MTARRTVYLFRSGDETDPYEEALAEAGLEGISIPVLRFEFVNADELRAALEHSRSYDGIILTSPRAVEALADVMSWLPTETMLWHSKAVFAVGPKTASELRRVGFEPTGEGSGSAALLAEHITTLDFDKPLLFLCGNRRRDVLPDRLRQAGIAFEELCVYESHPRESMDLQSYPPPDWVVFFSPSGLEYVLEAGVVDTSAVRVAAIGETTAEAASARGLNVAAVAKEPTPDALAQAIAAAESRP